MDGGWLVWLLAVLLVLAMVVWYLSSTAGRLDRLHRRVEVSWDNLVAALQRRRDVADHVAGSGLLDPASSLLIADAVARVDQSTPDDRVAFYLVESDLTAVLGAVFADPAEVDEIVAEPGGDVVLKLADACHRVEIGRRFYNDAVLATRSMRERYLVRWFRLQGTAAMPQTVEMADSAPDGFAGR
ncbi:MAG: hypothetical protein QG597_5247 [Actinomycetota bacterium]|nr:hypothetical protein [Actinomycetota bacterium]